MKQFTNVISGVVPLREENVDTDQIIPALYLTTVTRKGLGKGLFDAWRYHEDGAPNDTFVLNRPRYMDDEVLLAHANFGSGSSREHAVWALTDYGFKVVIAPSFADIFYNNSLENGLLPVQLTKDQVETLFEEAESEEGLRVEVDLKAQLLTTSSGHRFEFEIAPFRKDCLLRGLDDLGYLLHRSEEIGRYEMAKSDNRCRATA
jgi:3-isopropylmalate/(R)-2-methylmalate dehydratase small subunit